MAALLLSPSLGSSASRKTAWVGILGEVNTAVIGMVIDARKDADAEGVRA
jgi:hypothetical protein